MALRFGLGKRTLRHPAASLLAALLCVPALFLLCSWVKLFQPLPCGLALLGAVIIITYLYHRWGGDIRTCLAISGLATTAVICLDLLLGTPMMKQAVMSYNPINGGRYYGMGNAYCEVLLAAVLLGVSAWLDLRGCWRTSYLWYLLPLFGVIYENLRFLVFDELHTYRGRQGADIAMLIRRVTAQCRQHVTYIGTSATMVSVGSPASQREQVAQVATTLFGRPFKAEQIINEKLTRSLEFAGELPPQQILAQAVSTGIDTQADEEILIRTLL